MAIRPFCFIHAGEFHLEHPLHGVTEVPEHLRNLFLEAPYLAARRVFDAALSREVDFVVLSGDLVNHSLSGPRGPLLLVEQFQRMAERNIPIYWAGSPDDAPHAWPTAIKLPSNVHFFSREEVEHLLVPGDSGPLARIAGMSAGKHHFQPEDFLPDPAGLFTIAAAFGGWNPETQVEPGVHYWALGGQHSPGAPSGAHAVRYCGTTQGRTPKESGLHGCFFVQVDELAQIQVTFLSTDVVRWVQQHVEFDEITTTEGMEEMLLRRIAALREAQPEVPLLVSWMLTGEGRLQHLLRRERLAEKILARLRAEYGQADPPCWSVSLKCSPPETYPPTFYEEETIRGDFLKAIRYLQENLEQLPNLEGYLPESLREGPAFQSIETDDEHHHLLCEAAALGLELLSGEEPH